MLGLFSGKSNHPLADPKSARELFERLNRSDPLEAIDEIDSWLESTSRDELIKPQRRVELMFQLDAIGAVEAGKLVHDYLLLPGAGRGKNQKLWLANSKYWHQLADSYRYLLDQFETDKKLRDEMRSSLPAVYIRLLRAYGGCLKWDQFRYGPIDPVLWLDAGKIYLQGEKNRWLDRSLDGGSGTHTSVGAEYMRLVLFQAASMDRLRPPEIELAELMLVHLLPNFSFTRQVKPDNVYWIDAGKSLPPTRLARVPEVTPSLYFFATASALSAIEKISSEISATQQIPQHLGLGQLFSVAEVNAVLQHLEIFCSPQPPMRSHIRHQVSSWMKAVDGFRPIVAALQGSGMVCGTWEVEDVSRGGMRAQVVLEGNERLGIGSLVAMCPDGGDNWLVGIVRRFSRASQTKGNVGIETISRSPCTIILNGSSQTEEALLLDADLNSGEAVMVIVATDVWQDFKKNSRLVNVEHNGERFRLRPLELQEQDNDYVVGRYWVDALPG